MNDELMERLDIPRATTFCFAMQSGVIDLPARCSMSPNHDGPHKAWAGNGARDYITWEDDEHHN